MNPQPTTTIDSADQYQHLALKTARMVFKTRQDAICNWMMGLAGETGELVDAGKKHVFHSHPLDREYVKKELGDICWYVAVLASELGITMSEIHTANIEKLAARYPGGFDELRSINRDVLVEAAANARDFASGPDTAD